MIVCILLFTMLTKWEIWCFCCIIPGWQACDWFPVFLKWIKYIFNRLSSEEAIDCNCKKFHSYCQVIMHREQVLQWYLRSPGFRIYECSSESTKSSGQCSEGTTTRNWFSFESIRYVNFQGLRFEGLNVKRKPTLLQ